MLQLWMLDAKEKVTRFSFSMTKLQEKSVYLLSSFIFHHEIIRHARLHLCMYLVEAPVVFHIAICIARKRRNLQGQFFEFVYLGSRCRNEANACDFKLRRDRLVRLQVWMHTSTELRWHFLLTCDALCTWWWRRRGKATWPPCRHTRPGAKTPQGKGGKTAPSSDPKA